MAPRQAFFVFLKGRPRWKAVGLRRQFGAGASLYPSGTDGWLASTGAA